MASFKDILDQIDESISIFIEQIPASQTDMLEAIDEELSKLDVKDGRIKASVANIKLMANIKSKLLKIILTDSYKSQVKQFVKTFDKVTDLQNEYWRGVEKKFKPSSILKEIKKVSIEDTVTKLMEAGLDANVATPVSDILKQNITQGGSYKEMQTALKESITGTDDSPGYLDRYTKQVTIDSVNQYNRNYTQIVSNDLGYEWYAYQNTLITTSRPFCKAMNERRYFHISEIPDLLKAVDLYYTKDGNKVKVPLNKKTGLPDGMYSTTNVANFLTLLGGYNCGHQAGPVSDFLVKNQDPQLYQTVKNSAAYKAWKTANKKSAD
jgi:hypothetical protein